MTEPLTVQPAAPPKKRSLFKKAAWQTAVKPEGKEKDIFSHSDKFNDIIADQARLNNAKKEKAQAAKKRKTEEEGDRKRRRVSLEAEKSKVPGSGSGNSSRTSRAGSKGRSETPLSPVPTHTNPNSLSSRYGSLTKSSSSNGTLPQKPSNVIDLGDTDSDSDLENYLKPQPRQAPNLTIPRLPSIPAPSEVIEEEEEEVDPAIAALKARARARAAKESAAAASRLNDTFDAKTAVVQLFISSEIPDTVDMLIKVKIDGIIEKPWDAWCDRQGYPKEKKGTLMLTWREAQIYPSTTIARLGVSLDANGFIVVEDDLQIYDENNLPKIHLEVWTKELYDEKKKEKAAEAAAKRKALEAPQEVEEEPEPELVVESQKVRLLLKARGKPDFKICVNQDTTFGHLTAAFKGKMAIPKDCPITLMFDGERLKPLDTIGDVDIEDMDSIEVHYK